MTLIITATTPHASIHASDRRVVTVASWREPVLHSPLENKTIIFACRDAVGTIGFTGVAYVGSQPTDQWLAYVLTDVEASAPEGFAVAHGKNALLGTRLAVIVHRLKAALARLPVRDRNIGLSLLLAGFRIRRGRCFPFTIEIECKGDTTVIDGWMRPPRHRYPYVIVAQAGDRWSSAAVSEKVDLYVQPNDEGPNEAIRRGLIRIVRDRAEVSPTVGEDLMTVIVPNPRLSREIVWTFEPKNQHSAHIWTNEQAQSLPVVYSPWILTPDMIVAPCISSGAVTYGSGNYSFRCGSTAVPTGIDGIAFVMSSQERIPPPGRQTFTPLPKTDDD